MSEMQDIIKYNIILWQFLITFFLKFHRRLSTVKMNAVFVEMFMHYII